MRLLRLPAGLRVTNMRRSVHGMMLCVLLSHILHDRHRQRQHACLPSSQVAGEPTGGERL